MDTKTTKVLLALAVFLLLSIPMIALGDTTPGNSMMAASPVTSYTAGIMLYMLLVGFLVTLLLGGAFAVLSLGLMSKRQEDSGLGHWDPSDVAFLEEHRSRHILPAQEGEIDEPSEQMETRREWAKGAVLVTEDHMFHDEGRFEDRRAA